MKIFTRLLMLLLTLSTFYANGQTVATYSFAQSSGSYTPITGGTNFASLASSYLDDNVYSAAPIGFSFTYAGTAYTQFGINANGWISLGGTTPSSSNTALSTGATNNVIAAMNNDLIGRGSLLVSTTSGSPTVTVTGGNINLINVGDAVSCTGVTTGSTVLSKTATTVTISANASSTGTGRHFRFVSPSAGIRYETIGSAPNRILVVQWTGFQRYTTTGAFGELYNFQIRLTETSNTIETVYDILGPTSTTTNTYQIGLRGSAATDFNNRTSTTDWGATTAGGANTATITLSNTVKPASGQTYTWTLPTPCTTPAPGNTIASVSAACSGVGFNLSLQNSVPGSGVTYQWQSANDAGFTSGVTNLGTAATQTISQTAAKYYRCNVTCSIGPVTVASTPVQVTMDIPTNCYCTPTYSSGCSGDDMSSVTLGSLSSTGLSCTAPYYQNLSSTQNAIPDLQQSGSSNVVITFTTPGTSQYSRVWIDFDQSGTFETSESFSLGTSGSANPVTIPITIPAGATLGNTRMRIRGGDDSAILATQSCGASSSNWGMARDYTVNITAFTACSGTPEAGTISGSLSRPTCPTVAPSPATITATGATVAADVTYQWEQSTNGGVDWANVTGGSGATTATYTPPVYAGTPIQYRLKATCTASTLFDVSDVVVSIVNPAPPTTQASAITTSALSNTTATITWTNGNGGRRYVVLNTTNTFTDPATSADVVVAGTAYTSGEQIVFDNTTGSSVNVTNLAPNTTYYVRVYEYNRCSSGNNYYNTNTATNNPGSFTTPLYCIPSYSSGCSGDNMSSVTLGTLSSTGLTCTAPYYQNLSSTQNAIPDLQQSGTGNVVITFATPGSSQYSRVWIDFDQSGTFETSESFSLGTSGSANPVTIPITIPAGATLGNTRMRVRGGDDSAILATQSCGASSSNWGMARDYTVNITAFTACSGTPEAGTISGSLSRPTCPTVAPSPATITATGATAAAADITYQWEESINGVDWANVTGGSGATTATYTPPVYAGTPIQYRLKVTCTATSLFDVSDVVVSIVNPAPPTTQASAITTSALSNTAATITWTNGNGARRYVVLNTSSTFTDPATSADVVVAGTSYAGGEQIVFDNTTGNSVSVTGLAANTTYYVRVYEYNRCSSGNNYYNTTTATNNPGTFTTPLYCAPAYTSGIEPITLVNFAGINNTSPATVGNGGALTDFTSITGTVVRGQSYVITVKGNTAGSFTNNIRTFIDFNADGDMDDTGESFNCGTIANSTGTDGIQTTATIVIPAGATIGSTRMRVTKLFNAYQSSACSGGGYGQSEDYTLNIQPVANDECSGAVNINGNGGQAGQPTGVPVTATTVGATQSLANTCGGDADDDVWFTYTTDVDGGDLTINVAPSGGFDPVIELYSGTCGAPTSIACTHATQLNFTGQAASTTYFIRVYDFGMGLVGDVEERAAGGFTIAAIGTALPIELTSFTGKVLDHSNLLQWTTASERNVQSHNIERSINGINNWTLIGQTASKGNAETEQSYSLEDRTPLTKSYYRLRTVDTDGQEQISQVIALTRKDDRFGILSAFPNPAMESIAVQFNTNEEGTVTARITDVTGRLVMQQQMGAEKGINLLPIQLGQLSTGTYFITLQNGSYITEPMRFAKQ